MIDTFVGKTAVTVALLPTHWLDCLNPLDPPWLVITGVISSNAGPHWLPSPFKVLFWGWFACTTTHGHTHTHTHTDKVIMYQYHSSILDDLLHPINLCVSEQWATTSTIHHYEAQVTIVNHDQLSTIHKQLQIFLTIIDHSQPLLCAFVSSITH